MLLEILGDETFLSGLDSIDETERAQRVALVDAANAVQTLSEERSDLMSRSRAGEKIDPNHMEHIGDLLLEAQMRLQQLRQPPA